MSSCTYAEELYDSKRIKKIAAGKDPDKLSRSEQKKMDKEQEKQEKDAHKKHKKHDN